ncbi:MAG: hypothetical protein IIZ52_01925 [Erysipelotrichaceae bacterium]|nr:hypothetical protein [Erysipelotrichaceae bacterium]
MKTEGNEMTEKEPIQRAVKTSAAKPKTSAKTSSKTSSARKKTTSSSSSSFRLSNAEKSLIRNYRKCNAIEKKLVDGLADKLAGGIDYSAILSALLGQLKQ